MIIKAGRRVYTNTPEASPEWECFRPANENEHGEDVVKFKAMTGRWKYETSVSLLEVMEIVLSACKAR